MIENIAFFDISIFSTFLILIMLVIANIKRDHFTFSSRLLRWIMVSTLLGVILETIIWYVVEKPGTYLYLVGMFANTMLFLNATILMGLWLSYWDYKLLLSKKRIQQRKYYQYPTLIQMMLLLYNVFTGAFFSYATLDNAYVKTNIFFIPYLIFYAMFVYIIILVIQNRNKTQHHVLQGTLLFMILPFASSLIQLFFPEILFTWPSLTLTIIVVYLFLETTSGNIDELTKLYSRSLLELHLRSLIEEKKNFYAMMIDLDHFKEVNDLYGHLTGDQVLFHFSQVLRMSCRHQQAFIARLGGDEFFLICKDEVNSDPLTLIQRIDQTFSEDEFIHKFPFLGFSAGYVIYDHLMSYDDVLNVADKHMYDMKNNHQLKSSKKI